MAVAAVSILYARMGKCALAAVPSHVDRDQGGICRQVICWPIAALTSQGAPPMLDVILLAVGLGFFALSIAYAFGCDSL
jgi:hypothetical protein